MGRLRHDEDYGYLKSISEEVVDLFGVDAIIHKHFQADQTATRDPLWDEPAQGEGIQRVAYKIKMHFFDYDENPQSGENGFYYEVDAKGYVCLQHLIDAGIERDPTGDYIAEGDIIEVHKGTWNAIAYDVINTTKAGWVNTSHQFTGYNLALKVNSRFKPERQICEG